MRLRKLARLCPHTDDGWTYLKPHTVWTFDGPNESLRATICPGGEFLAETGINRDALAAALEAALAIDGSIPLDLDEGEALIVSAALEYLNVLEGER